MSEAASKSALEIISTSPVISAAITGTFLVLANYLSRAAEFKNRKLDNRIVEIKHSEHYAYLSNSIYPNFRTISLKLKGEKNVGRIIDLAAELSPLLTHAEMQKYISCLNNKAIEVLMRYMDVLEKGVPRVKVVHRSISWGFLVKVLTILRLVEYIRIDEKLNNNCINYLIARLECVEKHLRRCVYMYE